MSRIMIKLPGGRYATESEKLCALAWEAMRRNTSYGKLIAGTTVQERAGIIRNYCLKKRRKERRGGG